MIFGTVHLSLINLIRLDDSVLTDTQSVNYVAMFCGGKYWTIDFFNVTQTVKYVSLKKNPKQEKGEL